jgi:photosystem II stability/assembly factor-like uncharacterized protein
MKTLSTISFLLILLFPNASLFSQEQITIDSRTFGAIEARHIGPAAMSGRISALAVVDADPRVIYVGAASGGVWKSTNAGVTFKPVFDKHTQSIGGLAIDQARPDTVWVGTGEPWVRNSVSVGTGIYKTTDAGETWTHVGLPNSERINKIIINPQSPDTVYVAVLGKLWSDSKERGVYRTSDGGKIWENVLSVNERTGCSDIAMDPQDPNTIYAAMWEFRRKPWAFTSGGPGSGLYKSADGGKTWKKLATGLPEGELGRIAIAVAPSKPSVVYATVEAKKSGAYRSTDRGESWSLMSAYPLVLMRPFYFSLVAVDPQDHNRVYKPGLILGISSDSAKSWATVGGMHSDLHAIWIDPKQPSHILIGTDGGVYATFDRGSNWQFFGNLPVSQFYHIAFDLERPYNVYGGLQDNGSWMGPSQGPGGIKNKDWRNVGSGDGFNAFPDPGDRDIVYWQYQGGNMMRKHKSTGQTKEIRPYPGAGDPKYRWNWNTPIVFGAKSGALYLGAQFLFRSTDKGESWQRISSDLTTNDPEKQKQEESGGLTIDNSTAENHCTIFTISESPRDAKVVWAGTDDGNLQVTRDGGKTWKNVVENIPNLPANSWCMSVHASTHQVGTAYAAFSGHQTGDMSSYVLKTTDFGQTWTSLATSEVKGFARVIRDDLVNPNLLFLGTELGLFVSVDGGKQWAQFTGNLPNVPIYDLAVHPRDGDLILATHGRGVMIIDDISPLRTITPQVLNSDLFIFPMRPFEIRVPVSEQSFPGSQEFVGDNPPEAATITYYLKDRHIFGDLKVEIYSPEGKLLTTLPGGKRKGVNRVNWAMRMKPPRVAPSPTLAGRALFGPMVPEGKYTYKIIKQSQTYTGSFTLVPDPREPYSKADRQLRQKTVMKLYDMQADLAYTSEAVADMRSQANDRAAKIDSADNAARALHSYAAVLDSLHKTLVASRTGSMFTGEERLKERIIDLYGAASSYGGRPTESQLDRVGVLEKEMKNAQGSFEKMVGAQLEALNTQMQSKNLPQLKLLTREEHDKRQSRESAGR